MAAPPLRRCFIALDLLPSTRSSLTVASADIQKIAKRHRNTSQALYPVSPVSQHLTLAFLGDASDAELDALRPQLEQMRTHPRIAADLQGLGFFGFPPRVIFAPVARGDGHNAVVGLARAVQNVCWAVGVGEYRKPEPVPFDRELPPHADRRAARKGPRKSFHPHVTLARVQPPSPLDLRSYPATPWGGVDGSAIVLYESPQLGEYIPLLRVPLGQNADASPVATA